MKSLELYPRSHYSFSDSKVHLIKIEACISGKVSKKRLHQLCREHQNFLLKFYIIFQPISPVSILEALPKILTVICQSFYHSCCKRKKIIEVLFQETQQFFLQAFLRRLYWLYFQSFLPPILKWNGFSQNPITLPEGIYRKLFQKCLISTINPSWSPFRNVRSSFSSIQSCNYSCNCWNHFFSKISVDFYEVHFTWVHVLWGNRV